MMNVLRDSVAGRLVGGVAAGIKLRPHLDSPLTTRMVKLVTARSFGMASDFSVGNLKMDNTGRRKKQIDFPYFFTKIKAQMKTHKKRIYGPMDHQEKKIFYGPVFKGEVEKRYLEYLNKFDWKEFERHFIDYPRRRSENEKRLLFEKWASHHGRKYPSAELKEMRFTSFKKGLAFIDESNSRYSFTLGLGSKRLDWTHESVFVDKWDDNVSPVGNMKMDDTGRHKKIYFPSFFTKMKAQPKTDPHKKRIYGPVFTGEVEKRYLEYLKRLDWDSLHKHVTDFPRRRSDDEKRLIFDKWAAHYGKEYDPFDEFGDSKDSVFGFFKERLEDVDNGNSKHQDGLTLRLDSDADTEPEPFYFQNIHTYWVKAFLISYYSTTPPLFCELTGAVDSLDYNYGIEVCYPL